MGISAILKILLKVWEVLEGPGTISNYFGRFLEILRFLLFCRFGSLIYVGPIIGKGPWAETMGRAGLARAHGPGPGRPR